MQKSVVVPNAEIVRLMKVLEEGEFDWTLCECTPDDWEIDDTEPTTSVDVATVGELGSSVMSRASDLYLKFSTEKATLTWELFNHGIHVGGLSAVSPHVIAAALAGAPDGTSLWPVAFAVDWDQPVNKLVATIELILNSAPDLKDTLANIAYERFSGNDNVPLKLVAALG